MKLLHQLLNSEWERWVQQRSLLTGEGSRACGEHGKLENGTEQLCYMETSDLG